MVWRLLLRAEAADSRCTRSSAADEALTKGFSAERRALICFMSARQFSIAVSASISLGTIAPQQSYMGALLKKRSKATVLFWTRTWHVRDARISSPCMGWTLGEFVAVPGV